MCDTVVVVGADGVFFAKNSDRDANEAQVLQWRPRRSHAPGEVLRCTALTIPQVRETHAVLLSRPFWMWGAEIGANEHGVTIGNEAVFTRDRVAERGLTGMDLLRLALERAASAKEAVDVIVELAERHGQGGRCGFDDPGMRYHSSFVVADPRGAFVLETAGRSFAVEAVTGVRSISNALTIPGFERAHADRTIGRIACAAERRACTERAARGARGVGDLMAALRDHGRQPGQVGPAYGPLVGAMHAPCMHGGGLIGASQTVASWVSALRPGQHAHWVTGTAAPCTSLFKPVTVEAPVDLGPNPNGRDDGRSLFWRHERLHRAALRDPERLLPRFLPERDEVERRWIERPPASAEAFAEADRLLEAWSARVSFGSDLRPALARRYWRAAEERAR